MKQVYDLTVRLGSIDTENKELTNQLKDKERLFEIQLESQKDLAEQDIADASSQIEALRKMLDDTEEQLKRGK